MSSSRFLVLCLVSALAAFLGAFVSMRLVSPSQVAAQGQPPTGPVMRTQRLELVDKTGKLRGALSVTDKGGAALALYTGAGEEMVYVGADELGNLNPAIDFFDGKHGTSRLSLGTEKDGSPDVKLADAEGRIRLGLILTGSESGPLIALRGMDDAFTSFLSIRGNTSMLQVGNAGLLSVMDGGALIRLGTAANKESLLLNVEGDGTSWVKAGSFRGGN